MPSPHSYDGFYSEAVIMRRRRQIDKLKMVIEWCVKKSIVYKYEIVYWEIQTKNAAQIIYPLPWMNVEIGKCDQPTCWGDLLRSVPWPIFEKNSEFLLFDVYSFVFHWLLGSMWWKNTFPSSAIFSLNFLPIFTCLVSGHDNWHFLRIIWSGHFE